MTERLSVSKHGVTCVSDEAPKLARDVFEDMMSEAKMRCVDDVTYRCLRIATIVDMAILTLSQLKKSDDKAYKSVLSLVAESDS